MDGLHICVCLFVGVSMSPSVCVCVSVCVYLCASVCLHVCIYMCFHMCFYVSFWVCMSVRDCVSVRALLCICLCPCAHVGASLGMVLRGRGLLLHGYLPDELSLVVGVVQPTKHHHAAVLFPAVERRKEGSTIRTVTPGTI